MQRLVKIQFTRSKAAGQFCDLFQTFYTTGQSCIDEFLIHMEDRIHELCEKYWKRAPISDNHHLTNLTALLTAINAMLIQIHPKSTSSTTQPSKVESNAPNAVVTSAAADNSTPHKNDLLLATARIRIIAANGNSANFAQFWIPTHK
uniref:Uncharacterized protein n=1 Tax=Glossina brevipalpis TaxID=37001 RepID=A0A1A9WVI4_9MUSC